MEACCQRSEGMSTRASAPLRLEWVACSPICGYTRRATQARLVIACAFRCTCSVFVAWNASIFSAVWMLLAPPGSWYLWLAIHAALTFAAFGFGYLAGALTTPTSAAMFVSKFMEYAVLKSFASLLSSFLFLVIGCLTFSVFRYADLKLNHFCTHPHLFL